MANFDPEFTNSTLQDAGISSFDYEDEAGPSQPLRHSYVGPGGSLSSASTMAKAGLAINKVPRPPISGGSGSPITSSIQENFRGFTYTGESVMVSLSPFHVWGNLSNVQPMSNLAEADASMEGELDAENAVDDDDDEEADEEEYDDAMDGVRTRRQSDVEMD